MLKVNPSTLSPIVEESIAYRVFPAIAAIYKHAKYRKQ